MKQTKQEFFTNPKRINLSRREKEQRWEQHLATSRSIGPGTRTGYPQSITLTQPAGPLMQLSPCAIEYLGALVAPFGHKGLACIPDLHAIPSKKIRVKTRGTFSTGTNGFGFVVHSPWCTSNDSDSLAYTDASSALTAVIKSGVGVVNQSEVKQPYPLALFAGLAGAQGVRARVVGSGLRIRYIGPELARSGQIIGIREPDNQTLEGQTATTVKDLTTAKTFNNDREWITVMYRPARPAEYKYSPDHCSASDSTNTKWSQGFLITGTTNTSGLPGPAPFEFEVVKYVEYLGNIDNITRSHTDIVAMSDIRNVLPTKSVTDQPDQYSRHVIGRLYDHVSENKPTYHKMIKGVLSMHPTGKAAIDAGQALYDYMTPDANYIKPKDGMVGRPR